MLIQCSIIPTSDITHKKRRVSYSIISNPNQPFRKYCWKKSSYNLFILSSEYLKLYLGMTFLQYFWFVFAAKTKSEMAANNDFSCSGLPFAQLLTNPTYFLSNRQTYLFTFLNLFLAMSLTCRTNFLPKTNLWKIFHNIITGWSGSWLVVDWRKSTTERCEYNNKNRWFYNCK